MKAIPIAVTLLALAGSCPTDTLLALEDCAGPTSFW